MPNSSPYSTLILIALMVVAFYFLIIRPNKKRQQAQQRTMSSLTPGTRVLLTSGIFGTLLEVGDKQAVLELSPGVRLTVLKQAIARVAKPSDEETDDSSQVDESYDDVDDAQPTAGQGYDADSAGTPPNSSETPIPWSSEATSYPANTDQDPRSGTNTTPIKD
jgi:preprotein translocase subunit YajC